ncbi:MAG TPA: nitroreductase family protein [Ferruginibacter sp.]|nr:nitroreductase family protein [Chitinophagales bacterium]HNA01141.1 nitroreductase family protein [Ferruginibacter sp.]HNA16461.1 nitroreductase family protein [Ferruginibacter sp.]HNF02150.1 nitroreductase family protein [Ferruginibacter sp.]HNF42317.1 nitroreductase family protein [Ferruginibacter sp.]
MNDQKLINGYPFIAYTRTAYTDAETQQRARDFYTEMDQRRTCRDFSSRPVDKRVIEDLIRTASTAPSGAHKQPWTFCAVQDPAIKKQIRIEAEKEEYESYNGRMPAEWLADLAPLQTGWQKEFLEIAPWLIVVFKKSYEIKADGTKGNVYYANESVGLACGFLLAAIHQAGLAALTHTPSPMNFLSKVLDRPENEKPFLLIPVGYPAEVCWVPNIQRKLLENISAWY